MKIGQNKAPEILWLVPKWTFPVSDGAKVATDRLLGNLSKAGAVIDFVCLGMPGEEVELEEPKVKWKTRQALYLKRNVPSTKAGKMIHYLLRFAANPLFPLTMSSFNDKRVLRFVREICAKKQYDWIVLDGLHLGACFIDGKRFRRDGCSAKILYRAHNIEQDLWRGKARAAPAYVRPFFSFQRSLVAKYEKAVIENCDLVAAISKEDKTWIQKKFPGQNVTLANLGMDFSTPAPPRKESQNLSYLFLGRLDWAPNRDGLRWFLRNVWPRVGSNGANLVVAGSGEGSWLREYSDLPGIRLLGFAPDIDKLYRECHAVVAPIFYGSGTRIKIIEAYAKGRPVITTKAGAKGSGLRPGRDYFSAESAPEWLDAFESFSIEKGRVFAENGRQKLAVSFDEKDVAQKLYKIMS